MSGLDYALLGLIALAAFLALRQIWRGKGRCGGARGDLFPKPSPPKS